MSLIWPADLSLSIATKLGALLRKAFVSAVLYIEAAARLRRAISLAKQAFLKGIKDLFKAYFITV